MRSIVIAINRYATHTDDVIQDILAETRQKVSEIITSSRLSGLNIPIVIINCDTPTNEEIANLSRALNSLQIYQLRNMDEKEREIEIIYQELIRNRANILTETRQKVVMVNKTQKN